MTTVKLLIVDDEFGLARLVGEILTDEGYTVRLAMNGREGLDKALAERPDLILSDIMMPVMDGVALLKALQADAQLAGVPVLLMSSMSESAVAARCSGYVGFLHKPFKLDALVDAIARHLSTSPG